MRAILQLVSAPLNPIPIVLLTYLLLRLFFSCILIRVRAQFYFVRVHYLLI